MITFNTNTGQFRWIGGTNSTTALGVVNMPTPRHAPAYFNLPAYPTKLFLYGGGNFANMYGDLWEIDIYTGEFKWIHGTNDTDVNGIYSGTGQRPSTRCFTPSTVLDSTTVVLGPGSTDKGYINRYFLYNRPMNKFLFIGKRNSSLH